METYFAGHYPLPELTEKEEEALEREELHKVRNSAHVQKMEELIGESHATPPTDVDGAVLAYDGPGESLRGKQSYLRIARDEDGDLGVQVVPFLGSRVHPEIINRVCGMDEHQLLTERFEHVPPRSL